MCGTYIIALVLLCAAGTAEECGEPIVAIGLVALALILVLDGIHQRNKEEK